LSFFRKTVAVSAFGFVQASPSAVWRIESSFMNGLSNRLAVS
jgi:hypothetical protein